MFRHNSKKIFISYAHADGIGFAKRLQKDLQRSGCKAWLDIQRIHAGASWTGEIERALDESDVLLALLTPRSYVSEICRAEQLRFLRKGKCVIPLLVQQNTEIPLHLESKQYLDFTPAHAYDGRLSGLRKAISGGKGVVLRDEYRQTYVTAPPLPTNFVERHESLALLRNALVTDGRGRNIALTALKGMGGIGKTVLAQALCHDEVVQQAFPDGIIWISIGRQSAFDVVTRLREVGKALSDDLSRYDNELGCKNQYRSTIRHKAALIVIDDVWYSSDIEPFLAESPRSRLLFTTRDASIATAVGAQEQTVGLLTNPQSRKVLARWSGTAIRRLPPAASDLILQCGHLPLALAMVGAMLREKRPVMWNHVLNLLHNADLEKIKVQFPDYPHTTLFRAIQVSVDSLEPILRERYLALALLPEDITAHSAIQQTLWGLDEAAAFETAEQFIGMSLAQRDSESEGIRLHDLQLDYLRAQYSAKNVLALIHGAIRLSAHVVTRDPAQFASQIVGRLLPYKDRTDIAQVITSIIQSAPTPWLRPIRPALTPPGAELLRTLEGHSRSVNGVAISPDGRLAVSASADKTLKVWDLTTGRALRTLEGHASSVNAVAISPSGLWVVSASSDRTLKVWDLETGRLHRTLKGHSDSINGVTIAADGVQAISASSDHTLRIWDLETGYGLRTLVGRRTLHPVTIPRGVYQGLTTTSDWIRRRRRSATLHSSRPTKRRNSPRAVEERSHISSVLGVAVGANTNRIVSASSDQTVGVWDSETGFEIHTLEGHISSVNSVSIFPDGQHVVSASSDQTLKVWDLESGHELQTLRGHSSQVYAVAACPDGRRAVSASSDHTLKIWDLETGRDLRTLKGHSSHVYSVAVSRDGRRAISGSHDTTAQVWDLATSLEVLMPQDHSDSVYCLAIDPARQHLISASSDKTLKIWKAETGQQLRELEGHLRSVRAVSVSHNGRYAISASSDNTLKLWDLRTGRNVRTLRGHADSVWDVAFTSDGQRIVSASADSTLKVWDVKTGKILHTFAGHSGSVNSVAMSREGLWMISASWDNSLKMWDLEKCAEFSTMEGHSSCVWDVALTPDGRYAVSGSWDETIRIWDTRSARGLGVLKGHSGSVNGLAVSNDGRWVASASDDKTLRVWSIATMTNIAIFTCDAPVYCCVFLGDLALAAGDALGRIHLLTLIQERDEIALP